MLVSGCNRILCIVGSRPNYIKAAPVVRALKSSGFVVDVIDSGQHLHNRLLSASIIDAVDLKINTTINPPDNLFGSSRLLFWVAKFREIIGCQNKYQYVMVFGDVDTALAGALAAHSCGVPLIHVESGLRSGELNLREEYNRTVIDALADIHFCTEESGVYNIQRECADKGNVHLVGNTMIDSLSKLVSQGPPVDHGYIVLTLHRSYNVDDVLYFKKLLRYLSEHFYSYEIRFFTHPRAINNWNKNYQESISDLCANITVRSALPYKQMVKQLQASHLIITDSGGIQEEAAWLKKNCLTLRSSTERPSTIQCGSNNLCDMYNLKYKRFLQPDKIKDIPLWDGQASERIANILTDITYG